MLKKVSLLIVLIIAISSGLYFLQNKNTSTNSGTKAAPLKAHFLTHTSKLQLPFLIKIVSDTEDIEEGDQFTLTATVSTKLNIDNLELKWVLGDGLELIEGNSRENTNINSNDALTISITLKQLNDQNQKIHLIATSHDPGKTFSKAQQFNSLDQKIIDEYNDNLKIKSMRHMKK